MASKGGYLGGSSIIRVRRKKSKVSKAKEKRKRKFDDRMTAAWAAYKAELELPVSSVSPSKTAPSKAGKQKASRILKELEPMIIQFRQFARDFSSVTGEPSSLIHDLAIYEVQRIKNIIGVRRSLTGFDGWRMKTRVRALGRMLPNSSKDAKIIPVTIDELDKEWDELCLVLFTDMYDTHSIYNIAKNELCDVIGELGWKNESPTFVLPLSVVINLSEHVSGNKLDSDGKTIVEDNSKGTKRRSTRYFRTT